MVGKHDHLESYSPKLNVITNLNSITLFDMRIITFAYLIDEVALITVDIFDYVPGLGGGRLTLFFIIFDRSFVVEPIVF